MTTKTGSEDRKRQQQRLLAGDAIAWQEFLADLENGVRQLLIADFRRWRLSQIGDILSDTYTALLRDGAKALRRYDPARSTLQTFALGIAKRAIWSDDRKQCRRRARERNRIQPSTSTLPVEYGMADFLQTLTGSEQEFCRRTLSGNLAGYSDTNRWQLSSRVRRKFKQYCENDSDDAPTSEGSVSTD